MRIMSLRLVYDPAEIVAAYSSEGEAASEPPRPPADEAAATAAPLGQKPPGRNGLRTADRAKNWDLTGKRRKAQAELRSKKEEEIPKKDPVKGSSVEAGRRLYLMAKSAICARRERSKQMKESVSKKELLPCTFHPQLTEHPLHVSLRPIRERYGNEILSAKVRVVAAAEMKRAKAERECTFAPNVEPMSERIILQRSHSTGHSNTFDRLHVDGLQWQRRREIRKNELDRSQIVPSVQRRGRSVEATVSRLLSWKQYRQELVDNLRSELERIERQPVAIPRRVQQPEGDREERRVQSARPTGSSRSAVKPRRHHTDILEEIAQTVASYYHW